MGKDRAVVKAKGQIKENNGIDNGYTNIFFCSGCVFGYFAHFLHRFNILLH